MIAVIFAIALIRERNQPPTYIPGRWPRIKAEMANQLRRRGPVFWLVGIGMIALGASTFSGAHTAVIKAIHGRVTSYIVIHLTDGDSIRLSVTGDDGTAFEDQIPERNLSPPPPTFLPAGDQVTVYYDAATQPLDKSIYSTANLVALSANDRTYATSAYRDPDGRVTRSRLGGAFLVAIGGLVVLLNVRLRARPLKPQRTKRVKEIDQAAGNLITGIVERKGEGWVVSWVSDGPIPGSSSSASLGELIAAGDSSVAAMYRQHHGGTHGELQYAIYPWLPSSAMVILDITETGSTLEARDIQGSGVSVSGADIDEVIHAAERALPHPDVAMLRWIKHLPMLAAS